MRWLAGPQLEIYVQAAECQPGFMENTSEWSGLMHCPWSTQFSGSAPLPFSRFFLFLGRWIQCLAYTESQRDRHRRYFQG